MAIYKKLYKFANEQPINLIPFTNEEHCQSHYSHNHFTDMLGLNWYDNTARMHDPLLMRFTSPDPLWADYPSTSAWTHCAANPANVIDPDGRDIFNLSSYGNITFVLKSPGNDIIIAENGDMISLSRGTISSKTSGVFQFNDRETGVLREVPFVQYNFSGDGFNEFMFFSQHSEVEWDRMEFSDGSSIVGTSMSENYVSSGGDYIKNESFRAASAIIYDHSHSINPSGNFIQSRGDIDMAKSFKKIAPLCVFRVFLSKDFDVYSIFDETSPFDIVPKDGDTVILNECVVKPK